MVCMVEHSFDNNVGWEMEEKTDNAGPGPAGACEVQRS